MRVRCFEVIYQLHAIPHNFHAYIPTQLQVVSFYGSWDSKPGPSVYEAYELYHGVTGTCGEYSLYLVVPLI